MKDLLCASGGKCEGICREKHLHRKRGGYKVKGKTINEPFKMCKSAYEKRIPRVYRDDED